MSLYDTNYVYLYRGSNRFTVGCNVACKVVNVDSVNLWLAVPFVSFTLGEAGLFALSETDRAWSQREKYQRKALCHTSLHRHNCTQGLPALHLRTPSGEGYGPAA